MIPAWITQHIIDFSPARRFPKLPCMTRNTAIVPARQTPNIFVFAGFKHLFAEDVVEDFTTTNLRKMRGIAMRNDDCAQGASAALSAERLKLG